MMEFTDDKKEALKKEVRVIVDITCSAAISLSIVKRLHESKTEVEENIKTTNRFFAYSLIICWRITVIELGKLFSDSKNDNYRLSKLFSMLKGDKDFVAAISQELISQWESDLLNEKANILELRILRDKVYAHTDTDSSKIINKLSIEKCQHLIVILQKIIQHIYDTVFQESYFFDFLDGPTKDLQYVLDLLLEHDNVLKDKYDVTS